MCIIFSPYLHQKSTNSALNMVLTKFLPDSTNRKCGYGTNFSNYDTKFVPNIRQICSNIPKKSFSALICFTAKNLCK